MPTDTPDQGPVTSQPLNVPRWVFPLQLTYLITLVIIGLLYIHWEWLRQLLPNPAGPIPLAVPWWGALGGVTISFTGIFRNAHRWQPQYDLWHIARPFLGAVVGSVSYLIFIVVIRAAGTTATHTTPDSNAIFDLVAFLTGYREEVFRELLKRASDSLFSSPKA
jgi:hypothetical protein